MQFEVISWEILLIGTLLVTIFVGVALENAPTVSMMRDWKVQRKREKYDSVEIFLDKVDKDWPQLYKVTGAFIPQEVRAIHIDRSNLNKG